MVHRRPLVTAVLLAVAACVHAKPPSKPTSQPSELARAPSVRQLPSYRFVASGRGRMGSTALEGGAVGMIEGASRLVTSADGSVQKARMMAPGFLMGGEPVPARLGGGFLFWSTNVMYRARSFLGPLEPVAPLPTNAIDLAFGPASLLIVDPGGSRKAYDMERAQRIALSPPGVLDIATGDDERAVAVDAAGRALASGDGGKTWKDVTTELGGRPGRPYAERPEVGFEISNKEGVWLQADGTMVHGPLPEAHPPGVDSGLRLVMFALTYGIPLAEGQALIGQGPAVKTVDLRTGAVLSTRPVASGLSCRVLSTEDEGLAVCYQYTIKKPLIWVVSHVLGPTPIMEKAFESTTVPMVYGAGVLVMSAGCDGTPASSIACARRSGGHWTQYDAQTAMDATENPAPPGPLALALKHLPITWVPREDGGVTALATKRPVKSGEQFHVARFDPPSGTPVFFDKVIAALEHYRWVVGRDGTLRGFGPTSSIAVDARGHVETGAREFKVLAAADPSHALATDDARRFWQTLDGGAHWIEVVAPPGRSDTSETLGAAPTQCSLVGCVLSATGGSWLRTGWPEDPPARDEDAATAARDASRGVSDAGGNPSTPPAEVVTATPPIPSPPVLRRLRCKLPAEPRAAAPPAAGPYREDESKADESKADESKADESKALFGGRRLADNPILVSLVYRDEYTGAGDTIGPQSIGMGLRAVAQFPSSNRLAFDLAQLIADKRAVDALYVEPFDPTGTIVHATSSFASWAPATGRLALPKGTAAGNEMIRLSAGADLGARPVLSSRPGHADGVLLGRDALVMWVDPTGAVHPVAALQGRGIYSGYADAHGKLLVASESSAGGVVVSEAETGVVRLRLSDMLPFYPLLRSHASNYPEMPRHVFADPDAIAVAPDGSIGILRLPSGVEASTEDDPALLLTASAPPVALAPWSTIEIASSPACTRDRAGYRAVIQTGLPWVTVEGSPGFGFRTPGMSAMVRWGKDRVCLEAIEVGYNEIADSSSPTYGLKVMAVARFVGGGAGAGLVGTGREATVHKPITCTLE